MAMMYYLPASGSETSRRGDGAWRGPFYAAAAVALALLVLSCGEKAPKTTSEVMALRAATIPADPGDPAWRHAPVCAVPLILQDMVEPRLLVPSTPAVHVQAITDGAWIAFRIAWTDSTRDDLPGAARFSDACAVQMPAAEGPDLPAPQMGERGRPVEISFWSSSWQAVVDGRDADDIRTYYPGAAVDPYPFNAASLAPDSPEQREMATRYAPARAMENFMAGDGKHAVQDLVAEGPGTLTPASAARSSGRGRRAETGWDVVIARPAPSSLGGGGRAHSAFAVWEGGRDEVGARKMRSVWIPVSIAEEKQ